MVPMKHILIHIAFLGISTALVCRNQSFFHLFRNIVSNKFLHLLHSSVACNIILSFGLYFNNKVLGELSDSETATYNEKVCEVASDFIMLIGTFSGELTIKSLAIFSLLYAFKSFGWTFGIKCQKSSSKKMFFGTLLATLFSILLLISYYNLYTRNRLIGLLLCLEYSLVFLSLGKNLLIMLLDMNGVENNRTLFVFVITLLYLVAKSILFLGFIISLSAKHRFPYNTLRSFLTTGVKLFKKMILFKKYIKLMKDLNSIKETPVEGNCAICTDEITMGKTLKCSHVFHSHCLNMWCEREVSCPICRADLVFTKEEKFETEDEILSGVPIELEEEEDE